MNISTRTSVAALVLAAGALTTTALAGPASASASGTYEHTVKVKTNANRVAHDKHKLTRGDCVDKWAERQARLMSKKQKLYHQSLSTVMKNCHLRAAGENIAVGFPSGSAVVKGWMNSPGHRANILNGTYTRIGVGAVKDSHGRWWVSQVFSRPS